MAREKRKSSSSNSVRHTSVRSGFQGRRWILHVFAVAAVVFLGIATKWWLDRGTIAAANAVLTGLRAESCTVNLEVRSLQIGSHLVNGAVARKNLAKGEVVVDVDLRLALHEGTATPQVLLFCANAGCKPTSLLIFSLAVEMRNPRPVFRDYIASLDYQLTNFAGFSAAQLALVEAREGGGFGAALYGFLESVLVAGQNLRPPLSDAEALKAYGIVMSRAFEYHIADGSMVKALFPGADYMNHALAGSLATGPRCSSERCTWRASRDMREGEQVFARYGNWSNLDLLTRYGFVSPENPHGPRIGAEVFGADNEQAHAERTWLRGDDLCTVHTAASGPRLRVGSPGAVAPEDFWCVFLAHAFTSQAELTAGIVGGNAHACANGSTASCAVMLRPSAATSAHRAIAEACEERLRRFATSTAELHEVHKMQDAISLQLSASVTEERTLLGECARHHRSKAA